MASIASAVTVAASATRLAVCGETSGASNTTSRWAAREAWALAWAKRCTRALGVRMAMGCRAAASPTRDAAAPPGWASVNSVIPPSRVARSTGSPTSFL